MHTSYIQWTNSPVTENFSITQVGAVRILAWIACVKHSWTYKGMKTRFLRAPCVNVSNYVHITAPLTHSCARLILCTCSNGILCRAEGSENRKHNNGIRVHVGRSRITPAEMSTRSCTKAFDLLSRIRWRRLMTSYSIFWTSSSVLPSNRASEIRKEMMFTQVMIFQ